MATINGTNNNDELAAGDDANVYNGLAGDDYLRGGAGKDTYNGGDGFDRVSFANSHAKNGVTADLRTQTISDDGFGNTEIMTSIEGLGGGTFFADLYHGDDKANFLVVGLGDTAYGHGGDDSFQIDDAPALIDGGDGIDSITIFTPRHWVKSGGAVSYVTDQPGYPTWVFLEENLIVDAWGNRGKVVNIENVGGSNGLDSIYGDAKANVLSGYDGADVLAGHGGDDILEGGLGKDSLWGGKVVAFPAADNNRGGDTFRGSAAELNGDTIMDLSAGNRIQFTDATVTAVTIAKQVMTIATSAGEVKINLGSQTVSGTASFSGSVVTISSVSSAEAVKTTEQMNTGFAAVIGVGPETAKGASATLTLPSGEVVENTLYAKNQAFIPLRNQALNGQITIDELAHKVAALASDTAAVAVQAYQFFTGATPLERGIAYLVNSEENPNDLTDAYYARFNEANRYINFAANLGGQGGAGHEAFKADYGDLSFEQAVRKAYDAVIGNAQAQAHGVNLDAAVAYIVGKQDYFLSYGQDSLGAKAAMVGFLMQVGFQEGWGVYAQATTAFLVDAFDGSAAYNVPLLAVYGSGASAGMIGG